MRISNKEQGILNTEVSGFAKGPERVVRQGAKEYRMPKYWVCTGCICDIYCDEKGIVPFDEFVLMLLQACCGGPDRFGQYCDG
jgi:hypothetical protein